MKTNDQRLFRYKMSLDHHMLIILIQKIWYRDFRGGGRSSARETAMRVAAGAVAKKFYLKRELKYKRI